MTRPDIGAIEARYADRSEKIPFYRRMHADGVTDSESLIAYIRELEGHLTRANDDANKYSREACKYYDDLAAVKEQEAFNRKCLDEVATAVCRREGQHGWTYVPGTLGAEVRALRDKLDAAKERERVLQREVLGLRFRIHHIEGHNQYFFRCESSWCWPAPTEFHSPAIDTALNVLKDRDNRTRFEREFGCCEAALSSEVKP